MTATIETPPEAKAPKLQGSQAIARGLYRQFEATAARHRKAAATAIEHGNQKPAETELDALADWSKRRAELAREAEDARQQADEAKEKALLVLIGLRVHLWTPRSTVSGSALEPSLAFIMRLGNDGRVDLTKIKANYHSLATQHAVAYSETPKGACWSWMPNGVV